MRTFAAPGGEADGENKTDDEPNKDHDQIH